MKRSFKTLLVLLLFGFFLSFYLVWRASEAQGSERDHYSQLQLFTKVLNLVEQFYVEPIDIKKIIYGGIKGMLRELDPHTNFLPPDIFKDFENETSGEFGGIGIEITVKNGVLTVISPIEDTPAWKAGLKPGDRVVEINGKSTKGMSLVEAAKEMRGKKGDVVKLQIFRDGFDKPKEFSIQRGVVKIRSVKFTDLEEGYGFFRITSFVENTSTDLLTFLEKMEKSKDKIKGIILDLRGNPGGLLDQAIKVSDHFLEKGIIVTTIGRNNKEKEVVYARAADTFKDFPMIVLIDEYSASASEIVAGALKDNERALVMGTRSFGKGSVQSVIRLGDGSGLKMTIALYYTPSGKSIQAEGIQPDVVLDNIDVEAYEKAIIPSPARREVDIAGHLPNEQERKKAKESATKEEPKEDASSATFWWLSGESKEKLSPAKELLKKDFQVFQAYNYLKAWKVMRKFNENTAGATQSPKGASSPN